MTDASAQVSSATAQAAEFAQAWSAGLVKVLTQIAGSPWELGVGPAGRELPAVSEQDLHLTITCAGALHGEMCLRLPPATVLALAQLLLGEAQEASAECKAEHREAAEELIRQVAGQVATDLKPRWGEVQLHCATSAPPSWSAGASGHWWVGPNVELSLGLAWQLSAALVAELRTPEQPPVAATQQPAAEDKLNVLLDVELDVTLRFGSRRMLLRDILDLNSGSVVELDRHVQDVADLLLDNKLIARGEVVVVDGNYGLRVTEVLNPPLS